MQAAQPEKKVRVRFLRGYFPADPDHPRQRSGDAVKVRPGDVLELPRDEARKIVKLGIAERADDL